MGFRFRKSVKAGPFRMTFSKSGVGYSVGGKGFRVTKKAKGGIRTTASVPGTGVSYSKDFGGNKKVSSKQSSHTIAFQQSTSGSAYNPPQRDRFCVKCGTAIDLDAKFCVKCGTALSPPPNNTPKKLDIKKWIILIPVILFAIFVLSCIEVEEPEKDSASTSASTPEETNPTTAPAETPDAYAVVDLFISLFNDSSSTPISDIETMAIHGEDYKTEFRLNDFRNAVGKKGAIDSGTIEIISYGTWENDELRVYATVDTFDNAIALYVAVSSVEGISIPDEEISDLRQQNEYTGTASIGFDQTLTGYIHTKYSNGKIAGYEIMLDSFSLSFVS